MAVTLNQLGSTLLKQLYENITGGDESVPPSSNTFVSWVCPGLAFQPHDFAFCEKGIGGGTTAEEARDILEQAYRFAQQVDYIPDVNRVYNNDKQQTVWSTSEARLSHLYGEILRFSKVVSSELSEAEKSKLDKFRKALRTTRTVKDIITDEEKQVTVDGPYLQAYNEKMAAYIVAALKYNTKRVAAQTARGPEGTSIVMDWAQNRDLYRAEVTAAYNAWVSGGYKNEVEQMNAYIDQVTMRDMMLWKAQLLAQYQDGKLSAPGNAEEFYLTSLIPGNFATSQGWTEYTLSHSSVDSNTSYDSTSWGGGASVGFGLWSFGAQVSSESSNYKGDFAVSDFKLKFEMTQAVISRPWFYPEFFMNRGWMLRKGEGWFYDEMPSDGGEPPQGNLIAYPTTVLLVRNVEIVSNDFASAYQSHSSSVSGGGSIGWGPFSLSGHYGRSEGSQSYHSETDGATLRVPGMQVIGFINHKLGKTPNPLPDLKPEDFQ